MNPSGLDESRAVQLVAVRGGEIVRVGSGYLVAADLVLTAAHVVADADTVTVRRVVGRQQVRDFSGVTEWSDGDADVAVVRRLGDDDSSPRDLPPPRYGRVAGDSLISCQALGFPRSKLRQATQDTQATEPVRYRDTHHAFGEIPPYANRREGTLAIRVPAPEHDPDPRRSPWEGMSGAAVFADGALIGVVSEHHRTDGLEWLAAQRVPDWYDLAPERLAELRALLGLPDHDRLARVGRTSSVESHYLDKVVRRDIAPDVLYDRDAELAELARFCTDDTSDTAASYTWWRGPAWSGKSALMSWFALHPPPGIRTVAFFLRAQVPHQNTWIDAADNLLHQLAALLDEQPPTGLTDATRQEALLALMDEAAEACRRRGERLVLILDGLDEDQGDDSVAWLLPAEPACGMRVIVSGRDHPPLPDGVLDDDHPLCDESVIRPLAGSEHATMMRRRAVKEIDRLAAGTDLEKLLLGLVTAARAGLSAADLAFLAECDEFEIARQLGAVTGRTFTTQTSRYRPDTGLKLYVLAHRDLPAMVEARLGDAPLRRARQRLHAWFDGFRAERWPVDTPEYLLDGYFDVLVEAGDADRMVVCATDQARQRRMLDITGGNAAALAEIIAAREAVLGHDEPDLLAMTRLAIHFSALIDRNEGLSERLPLVWARLGDPIRAASLAHSITAPDRRDFALSRLARFAAGTGDFERATMLTAAVTDPSLRAESLVVALRAAAERGDIGQAMMFADEAEAAAAVIANRQRKASVATDLASALVSAGEVDRAVALAVGIEDAGVWIGESVAVWCAVVEAVAATGDIERARAIADTIADSSDRAAAVVRIAAVLAGSGDLDGVQSVVGTLGDATQQSEALKAAVAAALKAGRIDAAETVAAAITRPEWVSASLILVASALAAAGECTRAVEMAHRAEALIVSLPNPAWRWDRLFDLPLVYAQAGDIDRAFAFVHSRTDPREFRSTAFKAAPAIAAVDVDRGQALADAVADPFARAEVLRKVASVAGGRHGQTRAIAVLRRAETAAAEIADPRQRATMTAGLALTAAENGDVEYRDALLSAIGDEQLTAGALRDLALKAAEAGDVESVVALARRLKTRSWLLTDAVEAAAVAGNLDAAEAIARSFEEWEDRAGGFTLGRQDRVQALVAVADAAAKAGEHGRAVRLADEAETVAYSVSSVTKQWALEAMAPAMAVAGDAEIGAVIASYLADPESRWDTLTKICEVMAQAGDLGGAERLAGSIAGSAQRAVALAVVGGAWARAGDQARADVLAQQAEKVARSIDGPGERMSMLTAMAAKGDRERSRALAEQVDLLVQALSDSPAKPSMQVGATMVVARAGDWARAEAMAAEITDHFYRGEALVFVARAVAVAGDRERAENLVDAIDEVGVRAEALAAVATAVSEAGDHPAAIALAERAVASARAMPQDFTRISGMAASLPAFVTVLARAGEFDRAEEVARESKEWGSGRLWAVLAAMLPPPRAKRALAHALALGGGWAALLPALATVDPGTVRAVVDEFVAVLGPA